MPGRERRRAPHPSTHDPPHEQLRVRLGAGGVVPSSSPPRPRRRLPSLPFDPVVVVVGGWDRAREASSSVVNKYLIDFRLIK